MQGNSSYGSVPISKTMIAPTEIPNKSFTRIFLFVGGLLIAFAILFASIHVLMTHGPESLRPMLGYANPTRLHYHVYVIRHAEMKYQPIHKCSPAQVPLLSAEIGTCKDWGDNRCGGDYLVEAGHVRTRCIVETVPFDGLAKM
jgi:hypothetical protein